MLGQLDYGAAVKALAAAVDEVFSTMLNMTASPEPAYVERRSSDPFDGIVALVGLVGGWVGAGSVSCGSKLACEISSRFLMTEYTAVNEEVFDVIGELTNMIVGNFKNAIEETLGPLSLSIPTVIFGRSFTTKSMNHDEWIVVPYNCEGEYFKVKICLAPRKDGAPAATHGARHPYSIAG